MLVSIAALSAGPGDGADPASMVGNWGWLASGVLRVTGRYPGKLVKCRAG